MRRLLRAPQFVRAVKQRDDRLGCVVFSPLDAVEAQATGEPAAA